MSKKPCPIGLQGNCIPRGIEQRCINFYDCHAWTIPWPLPLTRITYGNSSFDPLTFDSAYWLVQFHNLYPPVNTEQKLLQRDWKAYFADYDYAEAEPLYARRPESIGWHYNYKLESWEQKKNDDS